MLEQAIVAFALLGATWVLYLLVALSILSIAIMIERLIFFAKRERDSKVFGEKLQSFLEKNDVQGAKAMTEGDDSMLAHVVSEGLANLGRDPVVVKEQMSSELVRQKSRFEHRLIFLGTLGNNAPFIGLFGTVLGIIRAFKDLSIADASKAEGSAQAVMAGISEALVATAIGLAVALPAVVAFNYFKSVVKRSVEHTDAVSRLVHLFAELKDKTERAS